MYQAFPVKTNRQSFDAAMAPSASQSFRGPALQFESKGAGPRPLTLVHSTPAASSEVRLAIRESTEPLSALPTEVLVFLAEFLEQNEVIAAFACTCRVVHAALMRTPDRLLKQLLTAQETYLQLSRATSTPSDHARQLALAEIDRAIKNIKADRVLSAHWEKVIKGQVASVQAAWDGQPRGDGVALSSSNALAKINRAHDAAEILKWHIAESRIADAPAEIDLELHHLTLATVLLLAREPEQALAAANLAIQFGQASTAAVARAVAYKAEASMLLALQAGVRPESALEMLQRAGDCPRELLPMLAVVHHSLGNYAESTAALDSFIAQFPAQAGWITQVCAWCGKTELAFEWLEKVVQRKNDLVLGYLPQSPLIPAEMKCDPRWIDAMRRLHRSPGQLASIQLNIAPPPRSIEPASLSQVR